MGETGEMEDAEGSVVVAVPVDMQVPQVNLDCPDWVDSQPEMEQMAGEAVAPDLVALSSCDRGHFLWKKSLFE